MSKKLSIAQRIKSLKAGESFTVKTKTERESVCRMAKALRDVGAIDFQIVTRADDNDGFIVAAI